MKNNNKEIKELLNVVKKGLLVDEDEAKLEAAIALGKIEVILGLDDDQEFEIKMPVFMKQLAKETFRISGCLVFPLVLFC